MLPRRSHAQSKGQPKLGGPGPYSTECQGRRFAAFAFRQFSMFRSVHDQVSRSGWEIRLRPAAECLSRTKFFTKLSAEKTPKRPLGSAYSIDNKRAPEATDRLLTEGSAFDCDCFESDISVALRKKALGPSGISRTLHPKTQQNQGFADLHGFNRLMVGIYLGSDW
jgi:hypothetical protein